MKNKNKKLKTLKGVLVLLQQLQLKYHGQSQMSIRSNSNGYLWVSVAGNGFMADSFVFWDREDIPTRMNRYNKILEILNDK